MLSLANYRHYTWFQFKLGYIYSSIVFTHSQPPLNLSFHRLTLLSPVLTAKTLPLRLQLTRQATASTLRVVDFHSPR